MEQLKSGLRVVMELVLASELAATDYKNMMDLLRLLARLTATTCELRDIVRRLLHSANCLQARRLISILLTRFIREKMDALRMSLFEVPVRTCHYSKFCDAYIYFGRYQFVLSNREVISYSRKTNRLRSHVWATSNGRVVFRLAFNDRWCVFPGVFGNREELEWKPWQEINLVENEREDVIDNSLYQVGDSLLYKPHASDARLDTYLYGPGTFQTASDTWLHLCQQFRDPLHLVPQLLDLSSDIISGCIQPVRVSAAGAKGILLTSRLTELLESLSWQGVGL